MGRMARGALRVLPLSGARELALGLALIVTLIMVQTDPAPL